jgi:bifunctional DNA-binding transcriptional regulator/antitoxin component of YhaV-PrlF toxin-antitoxin module
VRNKAGISPHDRVEIEAVADAIVIKRAKNLLDYKGFLGKGKTPKVERAKMIEFVANKVRRAGR